VLTRSTQDSQARSHGKGIWGQFPPLFCSPQSLLCSELR